MTRPRVLVVDARELVAAALTEYLRRQSSLGLSVERMRRTALQDARLPDCDVVVADESSARELIAELGSTRLVVIVDHREVITIAQLIAIGAAAVCVADEGMEAVAAALTTVTSGGMWLPPDLVGPVLEALMNWRVQADEARDMLDQLTNREREVLALLAQGFGRAEIAQVLSVSPHTVRTHVHHLLRKFSLHSQLAAGAIGRRLLEEGALDRNLVDLRDRHLAGNREHDR